MPLEHQGTASCCLVLEGSVVTVVPLQASVVSGLDNGDPTAAAQVSHPGPHQHCVDLYIAIAAPALLTWTGRADLDMTWRLQAIAQANSSAGSAFASALAQAYSSGTAQCSHPAPS